MHAANTANPLLDFSGLPRLDAIRPEHVSPAIDLLVDAARNAIEGVATDTSPATWDNVAEPLADALDRLNRAWAAVQHLNAVVSTPALRDAYHANLPKVTTFYTDLAQDLRLFGRYRALAESPAFAALDDGATAGDNQRVARFPPRGRGVAAGAEGALQGGGGGARRALRDDSTTTCSTRPMHGPSTSTMQASSPACRATCSPKPGRLRRPMAEPAGSSRCACRAINR